MTKERPPSLQDKFLQQLRAQKMPLTIFLTNGVKLQGLIASFDGFTVLLVRDGFSQLVPPSSLTAEGRNEGRRPKPTRCQGRIKKEGDCVTAEISGARQWRAFCW